MSFLDTALYVVATALAAVAAYFSVSGMVVLFPGVEQPIIVAGIIMEVAKLIGAAWLGKCWGTIFWLWKFIVPVLLLNVAVINASGVYAQLVVAHTGKHGALVAAAETSDAEAAGRIEVAQAKVQDLDRRIAQIDGAVQAATQRGHTNGAMAIAQDQRKAREALVKEREQAAAALAGVKVARVGLTAQHKAAETEATPIVYTAQLLGITADPESVIRVLIAMIVMAFDPLALALTFAVSSRRFRKGRA
jgi:hypothetical protein